MTQVKHVFFDLDHTLWDFESNSDDTFRLIFERNKLDFPFDQFVETYRPINQKYWKLFREERVSKEDLRYGRLKETFNAMGIETEDALIHLLSEEYIEFLSTHNALFEYTHEILAYLREKYSLHIITNGFDQVQKKKMTGGGLSPYFEQVITSEMVGVKKPNPRIFNFALDLAGAKAQESIMIGDNLEADIMGADAVGMKTILCDFDSNYTGNHWTKIVHLSELKSHL